MCPPVSPHKGASIVKIPTHNACIGWYGNAATRTFGRARRRRPYGFVWEDCMWTVDAVWVDCMWEGWFRLGGLRVNGHFICVGLRGKILRSVVGAVPVCPPVSPHKGASIVKIPAHNAVYFWYGNAAARTFGWAHRHRPYGFVWADCTWAVDFVGVDDA